jgi:hypothetical protein
MNFRENEIENIIKNSNVTKDAFELWKLNDVTKRFFLEVELDLLETRADASPASRDTIENIALDSVRNAKHCEILEVILEWVPHEIKTSD